MSILMFALVVALVVGFLVVAVSRRWLPRFRRRAGGDSLLWYTGDDSHHYGSGADGGCDAGGADGGSCDGGGGGH